MIRALLHPSTRPGLSGRRAVPGLVALGLLAVGLTGCGGGNAVQFSSPSDTSATAPTSATSASTSDDSAEASVSAGDDGAEVSAADDGTGASVSAGGDGVSVDAGGVTVSVGAGGVTVAGSDGSGGSGGSDGAAGTVSSGDRQLVVAVAAPTSSTAAERAVTAAASRYWQLRLVAQHRGERLDQAALRKVATGAAVAGAVRVTSDGHSSVGTVTVELSGVVVKGAKAHAVVCTRWVGGKEFDASGTLVGSVTGGVRYASELRRVGGTWKVTTAAATPGVPC